MTSRKKNSYAYNAYNVISPFLIDFYLTITVNLHLITNLIYCAWWKFTNVQMKIVHFRTKLSPLLSCTN